MTKIKNTNFFIVLLVSFSLIFGILIRSYNINYEDFWFDEILSFWIADPYISIGESLERHRSIEQIPFFFHLLLKFIHGIFGYETHVGRYLSLFFSILSMLSIIYLALIIKKNNFYILSLFLVSTNVFLVIYSQELRPYSLVFFLSTLNLIFFFKIINLKNNKKITFIIFTFLQILMILSHPFTLIIFFSTILFSIIEYLKFNKKLYELNYSILITLIFTIFYLYLYFANTGTYPSWIEQPNYKFYTNFYFSKFFGSRLVGLIYLIILLYLIVIFFKKFIKNSDGITIFLLIIILSYFLPLTYGYLFKPILFPKYIIFILVPIIILMSYLIFEINNKKLKKILIAILVIFTLGNQFTETNVKQFFNERLPHKPQFTLAFKEIQKSEEKYFTFDLNFPSNTKKYALEALKNYSLKLIIKNNLKIYFINSEDFVNSNTNKIWLICLPNVMISKCNQTGEKFNVNILKEISFVGINLRLVNKI
tara:strand:- start:1671 stop:3110 length:1440 start_codon:yes stop_codon:yes gene_type:complete